MRCSNIQHAVRSWYGGRVIRWWCHWFMQPGRFNNTISQTHLWYYQTSYIHLQQHELETSPANCKISISKNSNLSHTSQCESWCEGSADDCFLSAAVSEIIVTHTVVFIEHVVNQELLSGRGWKWIHLYGGTTTLLPYNRGGDYTQHRNEVVTSYASQDHEKRLSCRVKII